MFLHNNPYGFLAFELKRTVKLFKHSGCFPDKKIYFIFRCKMWQFTTLATALVSIYTLVLMSLDRFLAVVFPIESMTWRTEPKCTLAIAFTWITTGVFCIPIIFSHRVITRVHEGKTYLYCNFDDNATIAFLPESWDMRWNELAYRVSTIKLANGDRSSTSHKSKL